MIALGITSVMTSYYYHQVPHGAAAGVPEGDLAALRPRPRGGVSGGARAAVQPRPHLSAHPGNTGLLLVTAIPILASDWLILV